MRKTWTIKFITKAEKEFAKLSLEAQKQIYKVLIKTEKNPTRYLKLLRGPFSGFYKLRAGKYRIICKKEERELLILVVKIGKRDSVYKR